MAVRMSHIAYDEDPNALYRGRPPRVPRVRPIEPSARLLAPTAASLAAARDKVPSRADRERAERREEARRRLRLARVAKANGRLTVPQSPKFRAHPRARASAGPQLTMTSRELEEIRALRRRVAAERRKTQRYHDATTRAFPAVATVASSDNASFAKALRACGGIGVPAVRRAKLTTPVGFDLAIDRRLEARKRHSDAVAPDEADGADEKPTKRPRSL